MEKTIGQKIDPILQEIEDILWEFEANCGTQPKFSQESLRAVTKIFTSVLLDKMFELQDLENVDMKNRMNMAQKAGEDIKRIIKVIKKTY